ncbi:hypothetical protein [Natrinema versiforme]|uniref:Uncharacterized protein n=1 Tax=Natrinema versiforme JCM 10478 TaxID=1227496 RepID=L9Y5I5_9EURY|nr:hypothetical protein [Natrinema versiforme]ELY68911.1 hypothetical protein C489_06078 [Natrinema versiforme JCM 10478]
MSRDLHETAYREWKERAAEEYVQAQRRAFLDGFETAAKEADEFGLFRQWLREQRDEAAQRYKETDDADYLGRKLAYQNVLVKLSEIGVRGGDDE